MQNNELEIMTNALREALSHDYSQTTYDLWFADIQIHSVTAKKTVIMLPNNFKRDIVRSEYGEAVKNKLTAIMGFESQYEYISAEETDLIHGEKTGDDDDVVEQTAYQRRFHAEYTFENFVVGKSNELAQRCSLTVAKNPGHLNNPLFLYGPSGLGKTHLLFAIMNETRKLYPNYKIVYITSEEFVNDLVDSLMNKSAPQFRNKYRNIDMLLVDDIQFFAQKFQMQEEFFHTFNTLYSANKQIIIAADKHPREINNLEERLTSRFESGLVADIQAPDLELRIAIYKRKALDMGIDIPNDVLIYLAENIKINIRQIEGSLKRLKANSFITGKPIDIDMAKEILAEFIRSAENDETTLEKIFHFIQMRYGVTKDQLKSPKRSAEIMFPRHVAIYLTRQLTKMPLKTIARAFDRKDHTSIMNSITVIESRMKSDPPFARDINQMINEISSGIS